MLCRVPETFSGRSKKRTQWIFYRHRNFRSSLYCSSVPHCRPLYFSVDPPWELGTIPQSFNTCGKHWIWCAFTKKRLLHICYYSACYQIYVIYCSDDVSSTMEKFVGVTCSEFWHRLGTEVLVLVTSLQDLFSVTYCASCNCCHYFSSKARLIRGPDMILQEERGECIASSVSFVLAFCWETSTCNTAECFSRRHENKMWLLIL